MWNLKAMKRSGRLLFEKEDEEEEEEEEEED